tara:strand:+ start:736 stop:1179 length:444 start_codon:yes stop_codon:yes gene_type:complete
MRKFRRRKKRGPVVSKKVTVDGIKFASGLEAYMYRALKKAKIKAQYEKRSFELQPSFEFNNSSYERQSNGKGDMVNRGNKKILSIKYTPDFEGKNFVIECKGRANESFPIRWKLFKKHVADNYPNMRLYKPQKQSECDDVINLIKNG